jgi:hypothetical protein
LDRPELFIGEKMSEKIIKEAATKKVLTNKDIYSTDEIAVQFIEQQYPETADEFKRIQQEQYETFCKKQMDYGPSNISMGTGIGESIDEKLSLTALIIRINDKVQRLLNLVVKNDRKAQNEPVEDAFKDLSVYGIIAQIVKNGKWGI